MGIQQEQHDDGYRGTEAWFRIISQRLTPPEISSRLRLAPTEVGNLGDLTAAGQRLPHCVWSLKSPLGDDHEIDEHLAWFAETLRQRLSELRPLVATEDVSFFCSYCLPQGDYDGFTLSPQALAIALELDVRIEFHLMYVAQGSSTTAAIGPAVRP